MRRLFAFAGMAAVVTSLLGGCDSNGGGGKLLPPAGFVAQPDQGRRIFQQHCIACHGSRARGTSHGPPLIHATYRPAHHGDLAFYQAVRNGVRQHHWHFGDMPPVPEVSPEQAAHVLAWVRAEQRRAGIR
jgi:mono/diheme cytochrome c family protein